MMVKRYFVILMGVVYFLLPTVQAGSWDNIKPKADFRFRFEDYRDHLSGVSTTRELLRGRFAFAYEIEPGTILHTRLATIGKATSTNDMLSTDAGDNHAGTVYFDRIYLNITRDNWQINLGRMKNLFFRAGHTQLVWDGDMNFEGVHFRYIYGGAYLNLGSFWFQENKTTGDVVMLSSQLGYKFSLGRSAINIGISNYNYRNSQNYSACDGKVDVKNGIGMNLIEAYLELKTKVVFPITFFTSVTTNNSARGEDKAFIVGLNIGKAKKKGEWIIGANYRQVELNALEGRFMDGAFAGQRTDNSGAIIWGKYKLTNRSYLSFGYFISKVNKDQKYDTTLASEDYYKTQLDFGVSF